MVLAQCYDEHMAGKVWTRTKDLNLCRRLSWCEVKTILKALPLWTWTENPGKKCKWPINKKVFNFTKSKKCTSKHRCSFSPIKLGKFFKMLCCNAWERVIADRANKGSTLTLKPGFHLWALCGGELWTGLITAVLTVIVDNWEGLKNSIAGTSNLNYGDIQMMDYHSY